MPSLSAQRELQKNEFHKWIEAKYGSDDLLVNGKMYLPKNPKINGHPFYYKNQFLIGKTFIKGQLYDNLKLKYDILNDEVILKQNYDNESIVEVVLNYDMLDSFYIYKDILNTESFPFIKKQIVDGFESSSGYLQQIYKGKFNVYIRYKKLYFPLYSEINPLGVFSNETSSIFIYKDSFFHEIKNKRALYSFFKGHKSKIRKFLRKNKIKYKKANNIQLNQLFSYIDSLINAKN